MKKMKKIFSVIFAAAIVATMFVVGSISTSAADKITVYFEIPSTDITDKLEYEAWGDSVCVHIWKDSDANWAEGTTWPGFAAEVTDGVAKAEIPADTEGVIFNNATEGGTATVQTADIKFDGIGIVDGDIYRLTGETAENPVDSEKTVAVVVHEPYAAAAPAESTDTAPAESTDTAPAESTDTAPAESTDTAPAESTDTTTSDTTPVQTGDSSAAWILIAVVAASLGAAIVMTKKASAKD